MLFRSICNAGDHLVAANTLYGGSFSLLDSSMRKIGIETTFVDPEASESEIKAAFRDNTKALFA